METAGSFDATHLLDLVKRAEDLMNERRSMEREVQGLVADALDAGMCFRSIEFGMALTHRLSRRSGRSQAFGLGDIIRGGFYTEPADKPPRVG